MSETDHGDGPAETTSEETLRPPPDTTVFHPEEVKGSVPDGETRGDDD